MVKKWVTLVPLDCCLVVDSYFSSHVVSSCLRSGMQLVWLHLAEGHPPHSMRHTVRNQSPYGIHTYKNVKVGRKAARVVPFFSKFECPKEMAHPQARVPFTPSCAHVLGHVPWTHATNWCCSCGNPTGFHAGRWRCVLYCRSMPLGRCLLSANKEALWPQVTHFHVAPVCHFVCSTVKHDYRPQGSVRE